MIQIIDHLNVVLSQIKILFVTYEDSTTDKIALLIYIIKIASIYSWFFLNTKNYETELKNTFTCTHTDSLHINTLKDI